MSEKPTDPKKEPIKHMAYLIEHDLRQPLAVMKNSTYILNAKLAALKVTDDKVLKYMKIMDEEISRMNQMILDIVAWGRAQQPGGGKPPA